MNFKVQIIVVGVLLLTQGCYKKTKISVIQTPPSSEITDPPAKLNPTRPFRMGFTPWPYAATTAAIDDIYSFIDEESDMIAHHFGGGVPWIAAVTPDNFSNYGSDVQAEVYDRLQRTEALYSKTIYLAVSPFNETRDNLAPYWDTTVNMPLPAPFDSLDFDNDFVAISYANYVEELIKKFSPTYVNYAVEANEFYTNRPNERASFNYFASNVYNNLKQKYPNIRFMMSFTLKSPGAIQMIEAKEFYKSIEDALDMVGISVYPYAFFSHPDKGDPKTLPQNWLSQIQDIAPNKPYFIAETGFVAQPLSIPTFNLSVDSSETRQATYLDLLFEEASKLNAEGIVWFTPYDYDTLWQNLLNDNVSLIWRDTGLKDGNQKPRAALVNWKTWLNYSWKTHTAPQL